MKNISNFIESITLFLLLNLIRILPRAVCKGLGGYIFVVLGRFHKSDKTAYKNLKLCFPRKSEQEIQKIKKASWRNFGETVFQFPKIATMSFREMEEFCQVVNFPRRYNESTRLGQQNDKAAIFLSAHYNNWEISGYMISNLIHDCATVYRRANNNFSENIIRKYRHKYTEKIFAKGDVAALKNLVKHMRLGGSLAMLADQKMREGCEVQFFGQTIKAPTTAAEMSLRYKLPIGFGRVISAGDVKEDFILRHQLQDKISRENLVRNDYILLFEDEFINSSICNDDGSARIKSIQEITQEVYNIYEKWINEFPEYWFWMHNRFD